MIPRPFGWSLSHVAPDLLPLRRSAPLVLGAAALGLGTDPRWAMAAGAWGLVVLGVCMVAVLLRREGR